MLSPHITPLLFALHCLLTSCTAYDCKPVSRTLVQVDAGIGQVFGVNSDNEIFTLYGSSWTQLPGKLTHVTVGPAGVWGVNSDLHIFKLAGANWIQVSGLLKQIDAGGDQFVAGANHHDSPFCLQMESTVNAIGPNSAVGWYNLPGSLKYYSCGPYSCWGVNSHDQIFVRKDVTSTACQGSGEWQRVDGLLSMIEVGTDGSVYGVNSEGKLFRRDFRAPCKPEGSGWAYIPLYSGQLKHVSYDSGHLWLVLQDGTVYNCTI